LPRTELIVVNSDPQGTLLAEILARNVTINVNVAMNDRHFLAGQTDDAFRADHRGIVRSAQRNNFPPPRPSPGERSFIDKD
jgi:hypothetical protein